MALTRDFKKVVKARATRDSAFGNALVEEATVTLGSGNIFADLGLPDADRLLLKANLVRELQQLITTHKLTGTAAAKHLGVTPSDLSLPLKGHTHTYSIARLRKLVATISAATSGFVIGRENFEKICAVEGIKITTAMKKRFAEFDRKGLSPAERRREIIKLYGKKK
ncbi:XRE family transcriptional regulator [Bradyrhizobium sp. CSA207]|uniref:helix-turn-helix domain-containing protein n=1 Tax=Bradyrhizobium sp. CSA207 TaxID=2698826 RepID=UPI0023AF37AB|nr:XRE family transcriptional regulator [Bradyrhizobium sp. CSA207]MDE5446678.1 XRE family transcriptional regulator [Bradyrhizobium sp. CSA207]